MEDNKYNLLKNKSILSLNRPQKELKKHNSKNLSKEPRDVRFLKTFKKNRTVTAKLSYTKPYKDTKDQF